MARALRRPGLGAALAALVALSTLGYWLAARRQSGLWIMPDEAIYGTRAEELWQHGHLSLFGGYSVLYPLFAGGPLTLGSLAEGYAWLKPIQALTMSLSALPVYAYGRRLMPPVYALAAAALTVACPLLLFSGFVMTEVLYYPLAALTLLAIARAVETASLRDQALAVSLIAVSILMRVQAVVLLAVFAAAVLVDALLARRRPRWRAYWPVWSLLAAAASAGLAAPGLFGAYSTVVSGGYSLGQALKFTYYHLAYVAVMTAVVPVAALVVLLARERNPPARALLAVTVSAIALVGLQVGIFASRYSPHVLGRDLAALPPLLFLCFALWLARGAPRPRLTASLAAVALLAVLVGAPWNALSANALPDATGLALLVRRPFDLAPDSLVAVAAGLLLVGFRFLPARRAPLLLPVLLAVFAATSVVASNLLSDAANAAQPTFVGTPRDWIARAVDAPVAYVYNGDPSGWPVVWQQRFWNPQIDRVVAIAPESVPGPISEQRISTPPHGLLPIRERYAVANDTVTLMGTPLARQPRGPDTFGLTLWRLDGTPRLSTIESGFQPNGDISGQASLTVYHCGGGRLQLTLLPKASERLEISLDGRTVESTHIGGLPSWHTTIPVPAGHPAEPCNFLIRGDNLLGSTVVLFER